MSSEEYTWKKRDIFKFDFMNSEMTQVNKKE